MNQKAKHVYKLIVNELFKTNEPPHIAQYADLAKQINLDFEQPIKIKDGGEFSLNQIMETFCHHITQENMEKIKEALGGQKKRHKIKKT